MTTNYVQSLSWTSDYERKGQQVFALYTLTLALTEIQTKFNAQIHGILSGAAYWHFAELHRQDLHQSFARITPTFVNFTKRLLLSHPKRVAMAIKMS